MIILQQVLAFLCAPLVLFSGLVGLRGGVNETQYQAYKNVILFIGDGMGENHIMAALADDPAPLVMETMPIRGQSNTASWPGFILPDSASGGTALACGIDNMVGQIAVFPLDPLMWIATPATLAELAIDNGKLAGIVTTDSTSGATPAAFSAHTASRDSEKEISDGQMASGLTLIWGGGSSSVNEAGAKAGGFDALITTKAQMEALEEGSRSFGQFGGLGSVPVPAGSPSLAEMTAAAIDLLDDGDGFFLMVEAAHIDKYSHDGNMVDAIKHVRALDGAVAVALAYAAVHPETLILVTADHETGGVKLRDGAYATTSGGHTTANVPVLVNKADAGFTDGGVWKNRKIGVQLGRVLGFGPDVFPSPILPRLGVGA